ncbi:hypothetical protein HZH68_010421 [Vespula germanica]|uniref:Uncharacterized protein n=1 Tax=Vespula germanica TaxID=30212 RepID=A0A834N247_VESGE|nr:hypothetical protein HZH68_010421 [Vespula germanica]
MATDKNCPRMKAEKKHGTLLLLVLFDLASSAMVLPRPPSSPNHIHEDRDFNERKIYEGGKSVHGFFQNTNVERPDTDNNYSLESSLLNDGCPRNEANSLPCSQRRLVEIEVQGAGDVDPENLQGLVHAVLKNQQTIESSNESYPNPEVVPNSILGVRNIGISSNFRLDGYDDTEKRVLLSPPKLHNLDEKLYYLKSGKPKVYVNVRGNSGTFRKIETGPRSTLSEGPLDYLRVTRPFERQTDWKAKHEKKLRPPKKFDRLVHDPDGFEDSKNLLKNTKVNGIKERAWALGSEHLSTTENSMVTSSELPKQIPAPPSKVPSRLLMAQTTPVQRYSLRRTDVLPSYKVYED